MIKWLKTSNHWIHLLGGGVIYVTAFILGLLMQVAVIPACVLAFFAVLVTMLALEVKDKQYGNKFDIEDIVAGIIIPVIGLILGVLYVAIN